jgi:glycosyltransferase 2 family protein
MPEPKVADPPAVPGGDPRQPGARRWPVAVAARLTRSRLVRYGFVLAAIGLAAYAVASDGRRVWSAMHAIGLPAAGAALASGLAALVMTAQLWRQLLASLGSPLPAGPAARILFIGQLGKYLPGSVWPVLAQMELGRSYQVPRARSASASALMILLTLITGLLTGLAVLPFAGPVPYRWALLAVPVLLVVLYPPVLNRLMGLLLRLVRQPGLESPLTAKTVVGSLAWAFGSWICYGLQVWILAVRLGATPGITAAVAVGGFAFAWSAGFVVVFAPAGAGVRDVLLLLMLRRVLSTTDAAAVTLASRVLLTAADVLTAAAAARLGRMRHPEVTAPVVPQPGPPASRR